MDEDKIGVEVDLRIEDVYSFQKAVFYKQLSPVTLITIGVIFLILAVGSIIEKPPFGSDPIVTVALIFFPLLFLVIVPSALKKGAVNAFKTSKLLQKTQKYQIGTEGIEVSSESGQGFIKWDELYKAIETKDGFLFFISKQQAYVVPKRYFNENAQQMTLLRNYMKNVPISKDDKVFRVFKKRFKFGCLAYVILFFVILAILTLYSTK